MTLQPLSLGRLLQPEPEEEPSVPGLPTLPQLPETPQLPQAPTLADSLLPRGNQQRQDYFARSFGDQLLANQALAEFGSNTDLALTRDIGEDLVPEISPEQEARATAEQERRVRASRHPVVQGISSVFDFYDKYLDDPAQGVGLGVVAATGGLAANIVYNVLEPIGILSERDLATDSSFWTLSPRYWDALTRNLNQAERTTVNTYAGPIEQLLGIFRETYNETDTPRYFKGIVEILNPLDPVGWATLAVGKPLIRGVGVGIRKQAQGMLDVADGVIRAPNVTDELAEGHINQVIGLNGLVNRHATAEELHAEIQRIRGGLGKVGGALLWSLERLGTVGYHTLLAINPKLITQTDWGVAALRYVASKEKIKSATNRLSEHYREWNILDEQGNLTKDARGRLVSQPVFVREGTLLGRENGLFTLAEDGRISQQNFNFDGFELDELRDFQELHAGPNAKSEELRGFMQMLFGGQEIDPDSINIREDVINALFSAEGEIWNYPQYIVENINDPLIRKMLNPQQLAWAQSLHDQVNHIRAWASANGVPDEILNLLPVVEGVTYFPRYVREDVLRLDDEGIHLLDLIRADNTTRLNPHSWARERQRTLAENLRAGVRYHSPEDAVAILYKGILDYVNEIKLYQDVNDYAKRNVAKELRETRNSIQAVRGIEELLRNVFGRTRGGKRPTLDPSFFEAAFREFDEGRVDEGLELLFSEYERLAGGVEGAVVGERAARGFATRSGSTYERELRPGEEAIPRSEVIDRASRSLFEELRTIMEADVSISPMVQIVDQIADIVTDGTLFSNLSEKHQRLFLRFGTPRMRELAKQIRDLEQEDLRAFAPLTNNSQYIKDFKAGLDIEFDVDQLRLGTNDVAGRDVADESLRFQRAEAEDGAFHAEQERLDQSMLFDHDDVSPLEESARARRGDPPPREDRVQEELRRRAYRSPTDDVAVETLVQNRKFEMRILREQYLAEFERLFIRQRRTNDLRGLADILSTRPGANIQGSSANELARELRSRGALTRRRERQINGLARLEAELKRLREGPPGPAERAERKIRQLTERRQAGEAELADIERQLAELRPRYDELARRQRENPGGFQTDFTTPEQGEFPGFFDEPASTLSDADIEELVRPTGREGGPDAPVDADTLYSQLREDASAPLEDVSGELDELVQLRRQIDNLQQRSGLVRDRVSSQSDEIKALQQTLQELTEGDITSEGLRRIKNLQRRIEGRKERLQQALEETSPQRAFDGLYPRDPHIDVFRAFDQEYLDSLGPVLSTTSIEDLSEMTGVIRAIRNATKNIAPNNPQRNPKQLNLASDTKSGRQALLELRRKINDMWNSQTNTPVPHKIQMLRKQIQKIVATRNHFREIRRMDYDTAGKLSKLERELIIENGDYDKLFAPRKDRIPRYDDVHLQEFDAQGNAIGQITRGERYLRGVFSTKRARDELERLLSAPEGALRTLVGGISGVSATIRALNAAFDMGVFALHGLLVFTQDPKAFSKAVSLGTQSLFDPGKFSKYIRENGVYLDQMLRGSDRELFGGFALNTASVQDLAGVSNIGADLASQRGVLGSIGGVFERRAAEATGRRNVTFTQEVARRTRPVVRAFGDAKRHFEVYFNATRTVLGVEMFKNLQPTWARMGGEVADLVDFINKATGYYDSASAGLGVQQQALERAFLFFAPRYTRASMALMADVFSGGLKGEQAWRAVTQAAGVIPLYYTIMATALGQEAKLDPRSREAGGDGGEFLTLNIGGQNIGLASIWRAMAQTAGQIFETAGSDPALLISPWKGTANPITRFFMNRAAPFTTIGREMLNGTGFLGEDLDGWSNRTKWIGGSIMPFWVEAAVLPDAGGTGIASRLLAAGSEFLGARQFPISAYERLREEQNDAAARQFSKGQAVAVKWNDLNELQQETLRNDPRFRIRALEMAVQQSFDDDRIADALDVYYDLWDQRSSERVEAVQFGVDQVRAGGKDTLWLREHILQTNNIAYAQGDLLRSDVFDEVRETLTSRPGILPTEDFAFSEYMTNVILNEDTYHDDGSYNYDLRRFMEERFIEDWGPEMFEYVQRVFEERLATPTEGYPDVLQEWLRGRRLFEFYWNAPIEAAISRSNFPESLRERLNLYYRSTETARYQMEQADDELREARNRIERIRGLFREKHRVLDIFIHRWYGSNLSHPDNQWEGASLFYRYNTEIDFPYPAYVRVPQGEGN